MRVEVFVAQDQRACILFGSPGGNPEGSSMADVKQTGRRRSQTTAISRVCVHNPIISDHQQRRTENQRRGRKASEKAAQNAKQCLRIVPGIAEPLAAGSFLDVLELLLLLGKLLF